MIYKDKGELDAARKYLNEALRILDDFGLVYGRDVIEKALNELEEKENGKDS